MYICTHILNVSVFFLNICLTKFSITMKEIIKKAKSQLQAGDIKAIANRSKIPYQTIYKVLTGANSKRQNEVIKAVSEFLEERKNELEKLESVLN